MAAPAAAASPVDAYVGLGSNLGDRAKEIERAFAELAALPATTLLAHSSVYRSAPVDAGGDDYFNVVAHLCTTLAAPELLHALQAIEQAHGRERPFANAPRTLDLDLLLYGDAVFASEVLTLPHPRLHQRAFVLVPLAEIAPALVVPGRGGVVALRDAVAAQGVVKLGR
ncbi:MAG TPA: 2-amino-4-hydroxy-6-hydroxymethyldihydropteridine diphosphokinase [Caldimonas sp.]|jgi:2-amino-4-hydroxy-6-hydroxymethyldihydropteridine diphosphokinase